MTILTEEEITNLRNEFNEYREKLKNIKDKKGDEYKETYKIYSRLFAKLQYHTDREHRNTKNTINNIKYNIDADYRNKRLNMYKERYLKAKNQINIGITA